MTELPEGSKFEGLARVTTYAAIAALVTGTLFAADAAYRRYHGAGTQVAVPATVERSVEVAEPAPANTPPANTPSQATAETPEPKAGAVEEPAAERSATTQVPAAAAVNDAIADAAEGQNATVGTIPGGTTPGGTTPGRLNANAANPAVPGLASAPAEVAPQHAQPPLPPRRPDARNLPEKQAPRERAAPRRPAQAATKRPVRAEAPAEKPADRPNVYWEREGDSQLGFAPQLRRRTCDPATGNMPMQCYYPREGRERFPAKPVN
jgi:hypothetical protein